MRPTLAAGLAPQSLAHQRRVAVRQARRLSRPAHRAGLTDCGRTAWEHRTAQPSATVQAEGRVPAGRNARVAREAVIQRALVVIRAVMGLLFVACGVRGVLDLAPAQAAHMQQGALAVGGALLLAGSLLPLLKGTEVLVETLLDLQRTVGSSRATRGE